jgi:hypothetical protein
MGLMDAMAEVSGTLGKEWSEVHEIGWVGGAVVWGAIGKNECDKEQAYKGLS